MTSTDLPTPPRLDARAAACPERELLPLERPPSVEWESAGLRSANASRLAEGESVIKC
jgi:hypothetical protein